MNWPPVALALAGFAMGLALPAGLAIVAGGLGLVLSGLSLLAPTHQVASRRAALALMLVPIACAWGAARTPRPGPLDPVWLVQDEPLRYVVLRGRVASDPVPGPSGWRFTLAAHALEAPFHRPLDGQVQVQVPGPTSPAFGTEVRLVGSLRQPAPASNPGEFSFAAYLARQGVFAIATARGCRVVAPPRPSVTGLALAVRHACARRLAEGLGPREGALLGSLVLGAGAVPVDDADRNAFDDLGLAQVLAASGMQVSLLLRATLAALGWLPWRRRTRCAVAAAVLLAYAPVCGLVPSIVRATLLGLAVLAARVAGRVTSPLASLCAATLAMLVVEPPWIADVGFQLSFLATFALVVHRSPVGSSSGPGPARMASRSSGAPGGFARRLAVVPRWLATTLTSGLAATIVCLAWVLPAQLATFGQLSAWVLPANAWAMAFVDVLTVAGFAALGLGGLLPFCQPWVNRPLGGLLALFEGGVTVLDRLPGAVVGVAPPPGWAIALAYLALAGFLWLGRRGPRPQGPLGRAGRSAALVGVLAVYALALGAGELAPRPRVLTLWVLDVGQGDALVLRTPGGRWLVVDAGPAWQGGDAGARVVVPFLRHQGAHALAAAILTHPHDDHAGGLASVIDALPVRECWDSGQAYPTPTYDRLLAALLRHHVPLRILHAGDRPALEDDLELTVLSPPVRPFRHTRSDPNNNSLVLRIRYGTIRLLLAGDVEEAAEAELVRRWGPDLATDVLKVAHHGSRFGSQPAFLTLARPHWCLISDGRHNRFHHPAQQTIVRLAAYGTVRRTDVSGCLMARTDGRTLTVTTPMLPAPQAAG